MVPEARKIILCVNDLGNECEIFSAILTREGYEVLSARSSIEALQLIQTSPFDLGLFNIHLRDGSGLELLRKTREIKPAVPLIAWSNELSETTRKQAKDAGASAAFSKPFDYIMLITTIAYLLR